MIHSHSILLKILLVIGGLAVRIIATPIAILLKLNDKPRTRALIVNDVGEILLIKPATHVNQWTLPGGGYENGESGEQCISRELREELSIVVDPRGCKPLGQFTEQRPFLRWQLDCYKIIINQTTELRPNIEILEARWFAIKELPSTVPPYIQDVIAEHQSNR